LLGSMTGSPILLSQKEVLPFFVDLSIFFLRFVLDPFDLTSLEGHHIAANLLLNGGCDIGVLAQELFSILTPLAQAIITDGKPRPALLHQPHLQTKIDQATLA